MEIAVGLCGYMIGILLFDNEDYCKTALQYENTKSKLYTLTGVIKWDVASGKTEDERVLHQPVKVFLKYSDTTRPYRY